jgi:flagellar hook-associated protein 3 FlgL
MVIAFNQDSAVAPAASNYTITERLSGKVIAANQLYVAGQDITVNGVKVAIFGTPSSATAAPLAAGDSFLIESSDKQSLLTSLSRFSNIMKNAKNNQASRDDIAALVAKTLTNLDNALTVLASTQSEVGARLNLLDSSKDLNVDVELSTKTVLAQVEDLDYAEASTRLQMQTFVLSAAQQSFVKVSELSLFKYL